MSVDTLALAAPLRSERGGQKGAQVILTCPSEQPWKGTRHTCRASTRSWHSCPTQLPSQTQQPAQGCHHLSCLAGCKDRGSVGRNLPLLGYILRDRGRNTWKSGFRLDIREKLFPVRIVRAWNRFMEKL